MSVPSNNQLNKKEIMFWAVRILLQECLNFTDLTPFGVNNMVF